MGMNCRRICNWVLTGFAVAYVTALALLAAGMVGLLGQSHGMSGALFLLPLGLPWNLLLGMAPEGLGPWLTVAAPCVNIVLATACYLRCRRATPSSPRSPDQPPRWPSEQSHHQESKHAAWHC